MNGLQAGYLVQQTQGLISDVGTCLQQHPSFQPRWQEVLDRAVNQCAIGGRPRVVLTGQFSAGKSSLFKALTGEEAAVGAGVTTTQIQETVWRGMVLVDTPGVHAEMSAGEHDGIARDATAGADLVLFVISNEMFNQRLAAYFRTLAAPEELGLAGKMAIVVNKLDRERNDELVVETQIRQALEDSWEIPLYFAAAKRYLQSAHAGELSERFVNESRIPQLIEQLDRFLMNRKVRGQMATPLQLLGEVIDEALTALEDDHSPDRGRLELLRRQRRMVEAGLDAFRRTVESHAAAIVSTVVDAGNDAIESASDRLTGEDLQLMFEAAFHAFRPKIADIYGGCGAELNEVLARTQQELLAVRDSPLGQQVGADLNLDPTRVQLDWQSTLPTDFGWVAKGLKDLLEGSVKGLMDDLLKEARSLEAAAKEALKKAGKKASAEAVEAATKTASKAHVFNWVSRAVPFVAIGLDFYINYKKEKEDAERQRHLAKTRQSLRQAFRIQADTLIAQLREVTGEVRHTSLEHLLGQIDEEQDGVTKAMDQETTLVSNLTALRADRNRLLQAIMTD